MPEHKYGKRVCLQCGKEFEALRPAHITCSAECARERRRGMQRVWDARSQAKRKKYLLDLLAELDAAYSEMEWLNCRHEDEHLQWMRDFKTLGQEVGRHLELESELERVRGELNDLRAAVEKPKVAPRPDAVPQPVEKVAARAGLPPLQECPRMRLKAVNLPCGEHETCHKPTPCARLGGDPDAAIVLEPGERICKQCKAVFTPNSPAQKYCTKKCQEANLKAKVYGRKK